MRLSAVQLVQISKDREPIFTRLQAKWSKVLWLAIDKFLSKE